MQSNRERLDQGGVLERQCPGKAIEHTLGDRDEFGKRAVPPIFFTGNAEHSPLLAQIDQSLAAKLTFSAINGRIEGNAVACIPTMDRAARLGNDPSGFVSHDDRRTPPSGAA